MGTTVTSNGDSGGIEYDSERGLYRTNFGDSREDPCLAIVEAIARIDGIDPTEVEPLGRTVDVDALTRLVRSGDSTCEIEVPLLAQGYHVVIHGSGVIELEPTDPEIST